ncbi:MAG: SAM-dependent DNA methyltransferase [Candidatus Binatia bacterium]
MEELALEQERLSLQIRLDALKSQAERNRLGQFATPTSLAHDILRFGVALLDEKKSIRFLDPAIGTGSFFSALLHTVPGRRVDTAKGFELDTHYGGPAREFWRDTLLDLELVDFTQAEPPRKEADRFNLLICNPPYVRHHHIVNGEKIRLQGATKAACGVRITGLAGLYCYFLGLSHAWMQRGGVAGWLMPSEFMDVNYGKAVKRYLLNKVTLLRIHRFDPNEVQFEDALVSSAAVWFRNAPPPADHKIDFTFGGSLFAPKLSRAVPATVLQREAKWTRFPVSGEREENIRHRLADLFTIKRGIATGANKFFILTREQIETHGLPREVFRPILPSPRYVPVDEIEADQDGMPVLDRQLFLLACRLSEDEVSVRYPKLWSYLERGKEKVSERYLCRSRKVWYFQEERPPAPILCTYLGRSDAKSGRPFRFILNHSKAIAANVYLLLYPKPALARAIARDWSLLRRVWEILNNTCPSSILGEGRVYGGGLHKLEPRELGNVDATPIVEIAPEIRTQSRPIQPSLFDHETV